MERSCNTIEERLEVSARFAYPFAWRSLIDAHRGRVDRARATLRPLVARAGAAAESDRDPATRVASLNCCKFEAVKATA
jgi:hypothetical protein